MNPELSKKQNKKVTIFAIILSVVSIGLLVFGFMLVSSDKVIMLQSISNLSNKFDYVFEKDSLLLDKLSTFTDIGVKSEFKLVTADMNASLSFDYLENRKDKKSNLIFNALLNEENLLDTNLALADGNIYFFLNDITPHYYHTPLEYFSFLSGLSSSDYDKIFSLLKETIIHYIDNNDIQTKKIKTTYNGKMKKANKLTYIITNKTIKEIATKFINSLQDDKKLLTNLSSTLQQSREQTIQNLNEILKSLDYDSETPLFYYHVYYYGFNQIFSYELEEVESKITLEYKIEQNETIRIFCGDFVFLSLEVLTNKNQYSFSGYIQDNTQEKYLFTGSLSSDTLKLLFDLDQKNYQIMIHSLKQERDNQYSYDNTITMSNFVDEQETNLFTLNINLEYYFNQKVKINLENSTSISEITEEDINVIQNNILNHPIYEIFHDWLQNLKFSPAI